MPSTSASTNGSLSASANTTPAREFQYKQQVQSSTAAERTLSTSSDSSSTSSASSSSPLPTSTTSPAPISSDMLHHLALRMPFALHHPSSSASSASSSSSGSYTGSYYSSTSSSGSSSNRSSYVPPSPTITAFHTAPTSSHPAFASPPLHGPSPASRALASPLARAHRAPPPADAPPLQIHSTPSKHTLCVQFPQRMGAEMRPEMVTVCAKRGDRLGIVADAWHLERNCHYEWEVAFPPHDADMAHVHAKFLPGGCLTIDVWRR
ncbi:SHSP domain-containing protein [Pleurotus pulmonarius]